MRKRIYLHDIIELVLIETGSPMRTSEIAKAVENLWSRLIDNQSPPSNQVSARISKHPELFERTGEFVSLQKDRSIQTKLRFRSPLGQKELVDLIAIKHGIELIEETDDGKNVLWTVWSKVDIADLSNFINELGIEGVSVTTFMI